MVVAEAKRVADLESRNSDSVSALASSAGVSRDQVFVAQRVLSKGAPGLVQAVRSGSVAASAAAEVADLPRRSRSGSSPRVRTSKKQ